MLNRCLSELPASECPFPGRRKLTTTTTTTTARPLFEETKDKLSCEDKNKAGLKILEKKVTILDSWLAKILINSLAVWYEEEYEAQKVCIEGKGLMKVYCWKVINNLRKEKV